MRKRRTRSHIIADMSANHVERHVLLCGYSVERIVHDYGIDLLLYTYSDEGEIESDSIRIQLKATDSLSVLMDNRIAFAIERADLEYWLGEMLPVILIVYDAQNDLAYWVYVQAYYQRLVDFSLSLVGKTTTVYFDKANVIHSDAIRQFARYKASVLRQRPEVIDYHE